MRKIILLTGIISLGVLKTYGQKYSLYSNDSLIIESEYLGETIQLNLHLPETYYFSAETTKYPISIIFDSQHERTYPQIISSIDLLTSETQMPESIIIGVPFNIRNRRYFTSDEKRGNDTISGIERMELFLFEELLPQLQRVYKGDEFISIIGHSRTAFLVNYLSFKRPNRVNLAISLSGFYNDNPLSISSYFSFLKDPDNFPEKFSYYYTAGTTLEESTYLVQCRKLDSLLKNEPVSENVKVSFIEPVYANHITNYWLSVPFILVDAFKDYNEVLDNWFHNKLQAENHELSVQQFEADLKSAGNAIGTSLNPNLTHIYSLASHFAYDEDDLNTAIQFFELGLKYFPEYLELYIEIIEYYKILNNNEKINYYKSILRTKTINNTHISKSEQDEILIYLEED